MTTYNITELSVYFPFDAAYITGINDAGEIVGSANTDIVPNGPSSNIGFLIDGSSLTTFTQQPPPADGGIGTGAINNSGEFVGATETGVVEDGGVSGNPTYTGFISTGTLPGTTTIPNFEAHGINDMGVVVGNQGIWQSGVITPLNDPNAAPNSTAAMGINNSGEIVGYYTDSSGDQHGFIYQSGTFTTVDDPNGTNTHLTAINNNGEIVGWYETAFSSSNLFPERGLNYQDGTFTTLSAGSNVNTFLTGVSDDGIIVGNSGMPDFSNPFIASQNPLGTAPLTYTPDMASLTMFLAETDDYSLNGYPSTAELQTLIGFTNHQYAYGQQIGVMDPVIYAYQSLGAGLASISPIDTTGTDQAWVTNEYGFVFGQHEPTIPAVPTPAQVQHFVDQLTYFETIYEAAGISNPVLIARGAIFGQMEGFEAEMTQVPIVGTSTAQLSHAAHA